jgi:hypothetical protein
MSRTFRIMAVSAGSALALLLASFAGNALAKDRNHDRIPDRWEKRHKLSLRVNQARRDQDRDGLRNRAEFRSRTNPRKADTDGDGIEDGDEDRDRDGVDNFNEQDEGTKPNDRDTDNDGLKDGREDADHDGLDNHGEDVSANQPDDPDTDDDGIKDGHENAGVIASFDGTTLTIDLLGGSQLSGEVDASTEITCESEDEHEVGDDSPDRSAASSSRNHLSEDEHGDEDNVCGIADLTPGTAVHEADLEHGTTFEEIELVK